MQRLFQLAMVMSVALTLSGCSAGGATGDKVRITDTGFSPAQLSAKAGRTVTWTNDSTTAHTVTTADVDSGGISPQKTYSLKMDKAGTYDYFCRYHPTEKGQVTVR